MRVANTKQGVYKEKSAVYGIGMVKDSISYRRIREETWIHKCVCVLAKIHLFCVMIIDILWYCEESIHTVGMRCKKVLIPAVGNPLSVPQTDEKLRY